MEPIDRRPAVAPFRAAAGLLSLLLALGVAGCGGDTSAQAPAAQAPSVGVVTPVERTVTEWDEYTGRLSAVETVQVRPRVSGYVERVHFEEGSLVGAGDLLFTLDPRSFRATVAEHQAQVRQAEVRLELARTELARVEDLIEMRAVSQEEVDRRRREIQTAEAALESARAEVAGASLDLEFTRVVAPVSGRVGRAEITEGNLVTGGSGSASVLTTIVSLDPIYLYFPPDEAAALGYLRRQRQSSDAVAVEMALADETGFPHRGRLDFVDNRIDEETGTLLVRAVFDNPDGDLVPGLFARARLQSRPPTPALLIPERAVAQDQTREVVMVVGDGDVVERRAVTTGPTLDGMTVIRQGLDGGELVVVEGLQRAQPGATVAPEPLEGGEPSAVESDQEPGA